MTDTAKAPWRRALPWLIGGSLLAYACAFLAATTTGDLELYECKNLVAAVLTKNTIPDSKASPGQPAISCHLEVQLPFLIRYDKAYVYGITDKSSQDSIARDLSEFRREHGGRKILLQFFDSENWKTWRNADTGIHGGERGPETPSRLVWIK
jgi:hypothetical protein